MIETNGLEENGTGKDNISMNQLHEHIALHKECQEAEGDDHLEETTLTGSVF